jgi:NAD(P) transhydrogenase subunit alpha
MSAEYQAKQAQLTAAHIAKQDIVITTALIPGRPAPVLVTEEMARSMRPGSVILDMAVTQGGNCPLSRPDEVIDFHGVKIAGYASLPSRMAADASALYARNLLALLPLLTGEGASFSPKWDDEIIRASVLIRDGELAHPSVKDS